jgi:hypothetical protein
MVFVLSLGVARDSSHINVSIKSAAQPAIALPPAGAFRYTLALTFR